MLTPQSLKSGLKCKILGKKILYFETIDSTNEQAWKEALTGAPNGTTLFAEEQTRGRGRFGRRWIAPKGSSLLCSVILRPSLSAERVPLVTAIGAMAIVEAIEKAVGLQAAIQFPNDVLIHGKKVAGILVESRFISDKPDFFILGIGINVNMHHDHFPKEIAQTATSLSIENGGEVRRLPLAKKLLEAMERGYEALQGDSLHKLGASWRSYSYILKKRVRIRQNDKVFTGIVEDVDPIEGIVLRIDSGYIRNFRGEHIEKLELDY